MTAEDWQPDARAARTAANAHLKQLFGNRIATEPDERPRSGRTGRDAAAWSRSARCGTSCRGRRSCGRDAARSRLRTQARAAVGPVLEDRCRSSHRPRELYPVASIDSDLRVARDRGDGQVEEPRGGACEARACRARLADTVADRVGGARQAPASVSSINPDETRRRCRSACLLNRLLSRSSTIGRRTRGTSPTSSATSPRSLPGGVGRAAAPGSLRRRSGTRSMDARPARASGSRAWTISSTRTTVASSTTTASRPRWRRSRRRCCRSTAAGLTRTAPYRSSLVREVKGGFELHDPVRKIRTYDFMNRERGQGQAAEGADSRGRHAQRILRWRRLLVCPLT